MRVGVKVQSEQFSCSVEHDVMIQELVVLKLSRLSHSAPGFKNLVHQITDLQGASPRARWQVMQAQANLTNNTSAKGCLG